MPHTQGCLTSVHLLAALAGSTCFPLGDLSYFLVSSALCVENVVYTLWTTGEFSSHLICCIVGNGDLPDITVRNANLIFPYYIDLKTELFSMSFKKQFGPYMLFQSYVLSLSSEYPAFQPHKLMVLQTSTYLQLSDLGYAILHSLNTLLSFHKLLFFGQSKPQILAPL